MEEEQRITEILREQPLGMNIKEISRAMGISRNSAAKYLDVLAATGHLNVRLVGNAKLYYLAPRVPLSSILQLTREMIVMLDRDLQIAQSSDSFQSFCGLRADQVRRTRLSRLPSPILSAAEESELGGLFAGGPALKKEIRLVRNGSPIYLSARFIPSVFDGGAPAITVMFDNITDQRRAEIALHENERFLYNVLQVSPTPKFLIDRNHKVVFWNRALEIMTRMRGEDVIGTTTHWKAFYPAERPCLADIVLDGDSARFRELFAATCTPASDPRATCESTDFFPSLGPSGKWLRCTAMVMRDSHGNLTGAMETIEDVTEAKQREFRVDDGS